MIDVSVLYCGVESPSTPHRYGRKITQIDPPEHQRMAVAKSAGERRPIVVWNLTRTCNLKCVHCYTASEAKKYDGELSTAQCKTVLDDLAKFNVPAVLFSGGEPLVRPDVLELAEYARGLGLHVVLSTNGTLIDEKTAKRFVELQFAYIGISLDSANPAIHDKFRGMEGAFNKTMAGFRYCVDAGQKVGLRLTLTRQTCEDLDKIFDFIEREKINRACFYHLCPAGRGSELIALTPDQSRTAVNTIFDRTRDMNERGKRVEILTVDNHCDGPHLYLKMLKENHPRTQQVLDMIASECGYPTQVIVDIGPEFISDHMAGWARKRVFIQPGKPAQNGFIERFNRAYQEDRLTVRYHRVKFRFTRSRDPAIRSPIPPHTYHSELFFK